MNKSETGLLSGHPHCLLVGNGINLLFNDPSWESLIRDELRKCGSSLSYEELREMPATMQIVAATHDTVSDRMKDLAAWLAESDMLPERVAFLRELLALPVDDILTTNYGFELETADGMKLSRRQYSARLRATFDLQARHKTFRLYQYYPTSSGPRIWHAHGDAAKPGTMLMGHYYYAKQLKDIQDCVAKTVRRYNICQERGEKFRAYSWADQFLTGEMYILGLGMYLCESDLWYLLCSKKRNFPDTKTYFYDLKGPDRTISIMLRTYGVRLIDGKDLGVSGNYMDYYEAALADIRCRIAADTESAGGLV